MKTKKFLAIVVLALMCATNIFAQTSNDLDERTNELIKIRVVEEVAQFNAYLQDIADKRLPKEDRIRYKDIALTLFIGGGKEYYQEIRNQGDVVDKIRKDAVTMEITSLKGSRSTYPMSVYLNRVLNYTYPEVTIESTKWHDMRVSSVRKIAEGQYECMVYFEQLFIAKDAEHKLLYTDSTKKWVVCYIELVKTDDGLEILVQLGDIKAGETTRPN